jgi:hypothetical protein
MLKSLVSIEKEFDYTEVEYANPPWIKWIAIGFVAVVIIIAIIL